MFTLPRLIGHRGLAGMAPENTMPAFEAAHRHKLSFVELDAKLCASGELIVMHDNDVRRTTNGQGRVLNLAYSQLKSLDAGAWFKPEFKNTRIPLLTEVLDFLVSKGMGVNIELKPNPGDYVQTARAVAQLLQKEAYAQKIPLMVSSFSRQSLRAARQLMPTIYRGLLLERQRSLPEILHLLQETDANSFNYDDALIDESIVHALQKKHIPTMIWTVNSAERARALFAMGVSAVFSDLPLAL